MARGSEATASLIGQFCETKLFTRLTLVITPPASPATVLAHLEGVLFLVLDLAGTGITIVIPTIQKRELRYMESNLFPRGPNL